MGNEMSTEIRHIVIVGGDLHAWTIATGLLVGVGKQVQISVIDDARTESPGVTSLDISAHAFHRRLGAKEQALISNLGGSYCLGSRYKQFENQDSIFTYSPVGEMLNSVEFHHYVSKLRLSNKEVALNDYSIAGIAARVNRFTHPQANTPLKHLDYTMQLDSMRYRHFLLSSAVNNGVKHILARVKSTNVDEAGNINQLQLSNGDRIDCDFIFDCLGQLNNAQEIAVFKDVSKTISVNRTLSWVRETKSHTSVLRTCEEHPQGWLQSSFLPGGEHHQFSFDSLSNTDQEITTYVKENWGAIPAGLSSFTSHSVGFHLAPWQANVLAIGNAAGYLGHFLFNELFHTHTALERWLRMYPSAKGSALLAQEYNRCAQMEYEHVHDVHCLIMGVDKEIQPQTLRHRVSLFKNTGRVAFYENDVLEKHQWVNLFVGRGIWPQRTDPLLSTLSTEKLQSQLSDIAAQSKKLAESFPKHDQLLQAIRQLLK